MIVDADRRFLESIKFDSRARALPPLLVPSEKEAERILADLSRDFSAIFVGASLLEGTGMSVIRFARQARPTLPLYILHDGPTSQFTTDQLRQMGVRQTLAKPARYHQLLETVFPGGLEGAPGGGEPVGAEFAANDSEFVPTRAESFLSGTVSSFNVYRRAAENRYVKLTSKGEKISPEEVTKLISEGARELHIRREEQERFLFASDQLASAVLKSPRASVGQKIAQTTHHGEDTMNFLRGCGISGAQLHYASEFVRNVQDLVTQFVPQDDVELNSFLANLGAVEHAVSTTLIASILVSCFNFESERSLQIVGISSLLHDVGLYQLPPELQDEDEEKMTPEQLAIYHSHPERGAQMLKRVRGIETAIVQAVAQHHERINKKGFPSRVGVRVINRVAEFIGLADEISRLVALVRTKPDLNPLYEVQAHLLDGFSFPVVETFRQVFLDVHARRRSG